MPGGGRTAARRRLRRSRANGGADGRRRERAAAAARARAAARRHRRRSAGGGSGGARGRGVDAMTSCVRGRSVDLGRLVGLLAAAPIASSMRVSPTTIVSPRLELRLVDLLAVDEGALGRAEVDDAHVTGAVDLDDRVHAADRLVVELEVRRGHLAELDDATGSAAPRGPAGRP